MQELRANTAVKVVIGPAVAVGDGFTPVASLDLSTADEAEVMKHDASAVTSISGATFAAITDADGYYNLSITASLSDTEGLLTVIINDDSLILPIRQEFMVLSEAAYDSKYIAKDDGFMDVNIKTIGRSDTQETEASNLESACSNYSATRGLAGTALPAAAADAAGGLPISDAGGLDFDAILGRITANVATAAELAKVPKSDSNVTWNATAAAQIQSEANDALTAYSVVATTDLPANFGSLGIESDGDLTKVNTLDGHTAQTADHTSNIAAILEDTGTTIPGLIATAQADLDAITGSDGVTLATTQGNYAPATADKMLGYFQLIARSDLGIGTDRSTELAEINNDEGSGAGDYGVFQSSQEGIAAAAATLNVIASNIQTRIPSALVNGRIDATVDGTGMEAGAIAAVADGVWNEATSGHTTAGTFGKVVETLSAFMAGITSLASWLGVIAGKSEDSSTLTEIQATDAGANYDNTRESQEAIRDRGDSAWTGGGGGGGSTIVVAVASTVQSGAVQTGRLLAQRSAKKTWLFAFVDQDGNEIDVDGDTVRLIVEKLDKTTIINVTATASTNTASIAVESSLHATPGEYRYAVQNDDDDDFVLAQGAYVIEERATE